MRALGRSAIILTAAAIGLAGCSGEPAGERGEAERGTPSARTLPKSTGKPVKIGFDGPRFDACAGFGRVANLNPRGDNLLSVRAAPSGDAEEIDQLGPGRGVSMCQKIGNWVGIVYAPDSEEPVDCGTNSPVPSVREYEGPCNSGWVNENFIKLVAG